MIHTNAQNENGSRIGTLNYVPRSLSLSLSLIQKSLQFRDRRRRRHCRRHERRLELTAPKQDSDDGASEQD